MIEHAKLATPLCKAPTALATNSTAGRHSQDDATACLDALQVRMCQSSKGSSEGLCMCKINLAMR